MASREVVKGWSRAILLMFWDPEGHVYEVARSGAKLEELELEFKKLLYGKKVSVGNVFLNEGINLIWTAVCGGSFTPFNSANAYIGVGDGTEAADPTQTGLRGTNKYYKGMDTGYPTFGTGQKATFRSTFGGTEANFAWNEWTVANGPGDGYVNINRKVEALGTKTSGATWILTVELSIS